MRRIGFLPAFFVALTIVFGAAVFFRIRQYGRQPADGPVAPMTAREPVPSTVAPPSLSPTDTGIIVETAPSPSGRAPQSLRPATTASQPPPIAETPSFFERMVAPVVNAMNSGKGQAPPVRGGQQRGQQQASAEQPPNRTVATERGPSGGSTQPAETPGQEQDGSSDSMPPQLASIEFVPPQVQDGEETTLIVVASDNMTGVQSVSGTIIAPSGAVQGFACQREGAESNRYISRITVPRDAAEGLWRVNYLNMVDRASNAATLTAQVGTVPQSAAFRVTSSRPDSEGPTLKAIWIDRRAMRGGEKNTVFVDAFDEKSGVNLITGVFQSPSKFARVGFICRSGSTWTCEVNAPVCADCGDWRLEQIQLQDKANNMTTVRADNELVAAINIDISSDSCDATPPAVETLALAPNVVSNLSDSTITITGTLTDDACGVLSVSGQAVGPASGNGPPPRRYFSLAVSGDGRTWTGTLTVPHRAAKGTWKIAFMQILDRGHNLKVYGQGDPLLANAWFNVQ